MPTPARTASPVGMVSLPGGEFLMGCEDEHAYAADREGPVRRVGVEPVLRRLITPTPELDF